MKFKVDVIEKEKRVSLILHGHFDEHAVLPEIDGSQYQEIIFDTGKILSINSVGVRTWIKWATQYNPSSLIIYMHCPKIIVDQMNMVGQLLKNSRVDSFFTPYFCEPCNMSFPVLFSRGKEFNDTQVTVSSTLPCPKCQATAELDVIEKNYFKFLGVPVSK